MTKTLASDRLADETPPLMNNFPQRDYADVSERSELVRQTSLAVANAQSPPGECFVFGTGDNGQLGMGEDVVELARPRLLDTIPGVNAASVIKICCGGMHTLAVCQGGLMYSWGVNDEGALGRVTRKGAADEESKPGLVTLPSNAGGVVDVSTGDSHVAVVTSTGAIVAWGCFRNSSGQWAFTAGEKICKTPTVVYSPDGSQGSYATNVASGTDHVLALTRRGDVYSWGCPEKGRLGRVNAEIADDAEARGPDKTKPLVTPAKVPNITAVVTAVVAGDNHSFAICAGDDVVYAWGLNSYGQTGLPYDPANPGSTQTSYFPVAVPSLRGLGIASGDGGSTHTTMLTRDGKVYTFGRPAYGRLGQLGIDPRDDEPKPLPGLVHGLDGSKVKIVSVAAGGSGSNAAVTADGEAYVWGYGMEGNLGRGDDCDDAHVPERLVPTRAMAGKKIVAVSFGGQHTAALCVGGQNGDGSPGGKRART